MKINSLTTSEEQLMRVIWKLEQAFMRQIMEAYPEPKPHQNTVSTFLKILVEKDFLSIEKQGRIFKYIPKVSFLDYRKYCLTEFISGFYNEDKLSLIKDLSLENFKIPEENNLETTQDLVKKPSTKRADSVIEDWKKELAKKDKKKEKIKKKKKNKK